MMGTDNLLLEWVDPEDESKTKEDYRFDYIYVTIRAYGIPREARSLQLLRDILDAVGEPSKFHPLQNNMLFSRAEYIWGTAKMKVNQQVIDKISLTLPDKSITMIYLHYEKIGRICLFCGVMFHNAQHCPIRNEWIMERGRNRMPVNDIPFVKFGEWMIDSDQIPKPAMKPRTENNSVLSRFQRMFKEEQEPSNSAKEMNRNTNIGAGNTVHRSTHEKQVQNQHTRNFTERVQFHQTRSQSHEIEEAIVHSPVGMGNGQSSHGGVAVRRRLHSDYTGRAVTSPNLSLQGINTGKKQIQDTRRDMKIPEDGPQNNQAISMSDVDMDEYRLIHALQNQKGNGVNLDLQLQQSSLHNLVAEKQTQNEGAQDLPLRVVPRLAGDGGQAGSQSPSGQVDPYKPAGQQAGRTLSTTTLHEEDTNAYAAGEAETANTGGNLNPSSIQGGEHRRRPSGWDVVPTVGSGNLNIGDSRLYTPTSGGPIRNRYSFTKKMGSGAGLRRNRGTTADKICSPYTTRSSRFSAGVYSYGEEDDPMSIRTPSPSSSTGSLGSRYGACSPPLIISDKCMGLEIAAGYDDIGKTTQVQGQNQDNKNSSANEIPPLGGSLHGDMDVDGAMAPALKAPQEP